jgi:hypothetical protein
MEVGSTKITQIDLEKSLNFPPKIESSPILRDEA